MQMGLIEFQYTTEEGGMWQTGRGDMFYGNQWSETADQLEQQLWEWTVRTDEKVKRGRRVRMLLDGGNVAECAAVRLPNGRILDAILGCFRDEYERVRSLDHDGEGDYERPTGVVQAVCDYLDGNGPDPLSVGEGCPECGAEILYVGEELTSSPPQQRVQCSDCEYTGVRESLRADSNPLPISDDIKGTEYSWADHPSMREQQRKKARDRALNQRAEVRSAALQRAFLNLYERGVIETHPKHIPDTAPFGDLQAYWGRLNDEIRELIQSDRLLIVEQTGFSAGEDVVERGWVVLDPGEPPYELPPENSIAQWEITGGIDPARDVSISSEFV